MAGYQGAPISHLMDVLAELRQAALADEHGRALGAALERHALAAGPARV